MLGLLSFFVHAKGERYGGSATIRNLDSLYAVEGDSTAAENPHFGILHTRPMDENNNRWRWWIGVNYLNENVNPAKNGVYQEIEGVEIRIMPQYAIVSWGPFTPYIGAGLSIAYQTYSNRWQVDEQGYKYGNQLEDISQFEVDAVIGFGTAIKFGANPNSHLQLIPQMAYLLPINGGLGRIELSLSFLF